MILKFKPVFESSSLSLCLISAFIFLSKKSLPVFGVVGAGLLSALSTFLFYGFFNYQFIFLHANLLFLESLYNSILSIVLYLILKLIYGEER